MRKILLTLCTSVLLMVFSSADFAINRDSQSYGPTKAHDRLWRIALTTRPSSNITPQQMMVALWKQNHSRFKDNNMNGLYSGMMLTIPSRELIEQISAIEAERLVAKHNQWWQQGRVVMPEPEQVVVKESSPTVDTMSPQLKLMQLQAHLDLLSGQLNEFMFYSHNQLAMMGEDQTVVRKQLLAMAQSLQALSEQVDQQKATIATLGTSNRAEHFAWQHQLQGVVWIGGGIIALMMVLLLITWIKMIQRRPEAQDRYASDEAQSHNDDLELEDEYDFINSTEGIGAKLDLARAYIDMDDMKGAKEILQEVMKCGNSTYRQEAQHLLAHIEVPQTAG